MSGQRVGYTRVSRDQNPDRQLNGVPLDRTFTDSASGRSTARPQLEALLAFVRDGDTVLVHSMKSPRRRACGTSSKISVGRRWFLDEQ